MLQAQTLDQAKIGGKASVWSSHSSASCVLLTFDTFKPALQDKVAKCARAEQDVKGEQIWVSHQDPREFQLTSSLLPQSWRPD